MFLSFARQGGAPRGPETEAGHVGGGGDRVSPGNQRISLRFFFFGGGVPRKSAPNLWISLRFFLGGFLGLFFGTHQATKYGVLRIFRCFFFFFLSGVPLFSTNQETTDCALLGS